MSEAFEVSIKGHVAEVVLCGPGKGNAMGPAFFADSEDVFRALDDNADVRAIVLRGSGKAFCYGLDLMAMMQTLGPLLQGPGAKERMELRKLIDGMQRAISVVATCRVPVISAVHSWCIGGGLDLASASDIRLCSADAKFSLREVKVAMVADIGSLQRLPALIGEGWTRRLALTGEDIDAAKAKEIGLVSDVYDDEAQLVAAAHELANAIAENPPQVIEGIKTVMNERLQAETDRGLNFVRTFNSAMLPSEDLGEAMAAFMERRPPAFRGK